jgi:hypothetical protein
LALGSLAGLAKAEPVLCNRDEGKVWRSAY